MCPLNMLIQPTICVQSLASYACNGVTLDLLFKSVSLVESIIAIHAAAASLPQIVPTVHVQKRLSS